MNTDTPSANPSESATTTHTNRNSTIDLLRFVFIIAIVLFHQSSKCCEIFARGNMAVYFFFILSGYLAAKSVKRHNVPGSFLLGGWTSFMKRKVLAVHPEVILTSLMFVIVYLAINRPGLHAAISVPIKTFFSDILFLRMTGIEFSVGVGYGWYISSMLLGLLILYPLLRIKQNSMLLITIGLLSLGYIKLSTGTLFPNFFEKISFTYAGNFIAIAGLSLGASISSVEIKSEVILKNSIAITLLLLAVCIYCLNTPFSPSDIPHTMDTLCLASIFLLVLVTTGTKKEDSRGRITAFPRWRRICLFLGRLSLPLYLIHLTCHTVLQSLFPQFQGLGYMACYLTFSLVAAYLVMLAASPLRRTLAKWYE